MALPDQDWVGKDVIFVNPPGSFMTAFTRLNAYDDHEEFPAHVRMLTPGMDIIEMKRIDETTLIVKPQHGYLRPPGPTLQDKGTIEQHINFRNQFKHFETLYRPIDYNLPKNWSIEFEDMTIKFIELFPDGRPAIAQFRFTEPLDGEHYCWYVWNPQYEAQRFKPPRIGETVFLEPKRMRRFIHNE